MSHGWAWGRRSGAVLGAVLALFLTACGGGADEAFIGAAPSVPTSAASTTVPGRTTGAPSTNSTAAVTTTRQPTTTRPARTTTSTAPRIPCSSVQLAVETTTSQATYRLGETVRIQATLRNRSDRPCYYTSYGISSRIDEVATGLPVQPAPVLIVDNPEELALEPGQTLGATPTWDQQVCSGGASPCTQAPPGRYRARPSWVFAGAPVEGNAVFELAGP